MVKGLLFSTLISVAFLFVASSKCYAQTSIHDLGFLIGTWEVREDIPDHNWWEEATRVGSYILDSTFIELRATAHSSSGKQRTYRWFIHYNSKAEQFEMVSMFSNWHKVQTDILEWDPDARTITIRNAPDPNSGEYHERLGKMVFATDFMSYIWTGENKYGDPGDPGIWRYKEKGSRVDQ